MTKWVFLLIALFCAGHAEANWTHFIYIAGNLDYLGPVYLKNGKVNLQDQALALYKRALETAAKDRDDNFVVFYDAKKNPHSAYLTIFAKGQKKLEQNSRPSLSQLDPKNFAAVLAEAEKVLGPGMSGGKASFYYYGERFLELPRDNLDVSHPQQEFSHSIFLQALEPYRQVFGKLGFVLLQTCNIGSLDFVAQLYDYADAVLVPVAKVPNAAPDLSAYLSPSQNSATWVMNFVTANKNSAYRFQWNAAEASAVTKLAELVNQLRQKMDSATARTLMLQVVQNAKTKSELLKATPGDQAGTDLSEIALEGLSNKAYFFESAKGQELDLSLMDYLELVFQTVPEGTSSEEIETLIAQYPDLKQLWVSIDIL